MVARILVAIWAGGGIANRVPIGKPSKWFPQRRSPKKCQVLQNREIQDLFGKFRSSKTFF